MLFFRLGPFLTDMNKQLLRKPRGIWGDHKSAMPIRSSSHRTISGWDELDSVCHALSHDLRAPLRAIDGSAKLLRTSLEKRLNRDESEKLQALIQASQLEAHLMDSLLLLCRIARMDLRKQPVNVTKLANTILGELSGDMPSRQKSFSVSLNLMAYADARLLEIALRQLLENAWKFTKNEKETRITFGAAKLDSGLTFYVHDNGVGFNPAQAGKLFGIFERLETAADFAGVGIGLAIVQKVIDRHGGAIRAWSEVGKGATFWFSLGDGLT